MMRAVAFVALAILAAVHASDEKGDVGTVIGIDLGTTYSWFARYPRHVRASLSALHVVALLAHVC